VVRGHPTYNRLPILRKCLAALEAQVGSGAPVRTSESVAVIDRESYAPVLLAAPGMPFRAWQGKRGSLS